MTLEQRLERVEEFMYDNFDKIPRVERQTSELEKEMIKLTRNVNRLSFEMQEFKDEMRESRERSEHEMKEFKDEMKEFKDEMKEFKDEMKEFKDEMKEFKDEMKEFKDEMKEFKDEMKEFKDEMRQSKKDLDKKWGELANKMGTLVEDIFYPSSDIALEKKFNCKLDRIFRNVKECRNGVNEEYDIIGYSGDRLFLIEVKSRPGRTETIVGFFDKVKKAPQILGEYEILPIYAGLDMTEATINIIKNNGGYCMMLRGDILEIV